MLSRRSLFRSSLAASSAMLLERGPLRLLAAEGAVDFEPFRQLIAGAVGRGEATGVALAVWRGGRVVWEEGFGFADRERRVASTAHTSYSLASITKTFTATLAALLAEEKAISLDAAAMRYLQATPLQGSNGDPRNVTIRMLGAHCSGLPLTFAAHLVGGPAPPLNTAAYLREYGRLAYPAGQVYEYGNIGFEALGAIIERLTGRAFARVLDERLLRPLQLRDSFFSDAAGRISSAARGYDANGKRIPSYCTSTPPSGELYASVHDLARFALASFSEAKGSSVLTDGVRGAVRTPVFHGPHGVSSTFGWFTGKLAGGEPYYFKAGGQPGVAAKMFMLPSVDAGCAVVTNRTDNMRLVDECCRRILREYVPRFSVPEEDAGPGTSPFRATEEMIGVWRGKLLNGGADQVVRFRMDADGSATLGLSDGSPKPVRNMRGEVPGFEGTTSGLVECRDADAFGVRTLVLKLVPHEGRLVGRVTAQGARPGMLLANIPYVVTLERA